MGWIGKYMELLKLSVEALTERKMRAGLTILMVTIGTSLLVAVNGISTGTVAYINSQFENIGANLLIINPRSSDEPLDDFFIDDVKKIDGVYDVVPFYQQIAIISSRGKTQSIIVMGIEQDKLHLIYPTFKLKEGNLVPESDSTGIILGHELAYGSDPENPFAVVGQTVRIQFSKNVRGETIQYKKSFVVRGIIDYIGSGIVPVDQMAFIPLRVAEDFFERDGRYDGVYVITKDPSYNEYVMEKIREKYNVNIISPKALIDAIIKIEDAVTFFIDNISAVSLLVAAVGIITTLWTSVLERVREIGVLKAIGFKEIHILILFLNEALIVGFLGGALGIVTGIGLAYAFKLIIVHEATKYIQPLFLPEHFIEAFSLSIVLSAIAGFYPSWRAAKLDPVVAIRYE